MEQLFKVVDWFFGVWEEPYFLKFLKKIQNVKKRVKFGAVFSLEGVIFLIQSTKQKLLSLIFYFQNTHNLNS